MLRSAASEISKAVELNICGGSEIASEKSMTYATTVPGGNGGTDGGMDGGGGVGGGGDGGGAAGNGGGDGGGLGGGAPNDDRLVLVGDLLRIRRPSLLPSDRVAVASTVLLA